MENQQQTQPQQPQQQNIQQKPKKSIWKKWWFWVIAVFVLLIIIGASSGEETTQKTTTPKPTPEKTTPTSTSTPTPKETLSKEPVDRIEDIVKDTLGEVEVTIWDSKGDMADNKTNPPFEIVVNTTGQIKSCTHAKTALFELMESLYTDSVLKGKIARAMFSAPGYLRSSLGYSDAKDLDWKDIGASNFWTVTLKYKSHEDESGPLNQRTWGVSINNCE